MAAYWLSIGKKFGLNHFIGMVGKSVRSAQAQSHISNIRHPFERKSSSTIHHVHHRKL